jgi:hypothetical protein
MDDRDIIAAVSAKTGAPAHLVKLRQQLGLDGEQQLIWVIPGADAGFYLIEEDDVGGQWVVVLTGNE